MACVSRLELNILQVDLVYLFPLTPCKQELCVVCHYTELSNSSLWVSVSV